jgi:hypothetical protein
MESPGCDEYPYFSSRQGVNGVGVSLAVVDTEQNTIEGGRFGNFVVSCQMQSASLANPEASGSAFLVIPNRLIPTNYTCGNQVE